MKLPGGGAALLEPAGPRPPGIEQARDNGILWLRLLGGFEVRRGTEVVPLPRACAEVLSFLVLAGGAAERSVVAGALWGDKPESRACANLRTALWRLPSAGAIVAAPGRRLVLSDKLVTDVAILEDGARRLIQGVLDDQSPGLEQLEGDLLPGWDQLWVVLERERLRQLRLYALEALSRQLVRAGRIAEAVMAGLAAVRGEPLRESANRALITAHLADGNLVEAARQYRRYRDLMQDELGVAPSRDLTTLLGTAIHR